MKPLKIMIGMMIILAAASAQAAVDDGASLLPRGFSEQLSSFEQENDISIIFVTVEETADIGSSAQDYINTTDADLAVVYSFKENAIAVARPLSRAPVMSDSAVRSMLERRYAQKEAIATKEDAGELLSGLFSDMKAAIGNKAEGQAAGICSIMKDGYCDKGCSNDLDCECGDSVCEYHETPDTCPADCARTGDYTCAFISDNQCDKTCAIADIDCSVMDFSNKAFNYAKANPRGITMLEATLGSVLLVLMAVIIYLLEKTKGFRKRAG